MEKSATEGKIEYISNKISDGFKSESVRIILAKAFDCAEQVTNNQELSKLLKKLNNAIADCLKKQKELDNHKSAIET